MGDETTPRPVTTHRVGSGDDAITYDPRGAGRNPQATADISAERHAEDLRRVISDAGVGPVDAFGSSGGAVTLLALLAAAPDLVRRAVVHEPPLASGLPDPAMFGMPTGDDGARTNPLFRNMPALIDYRIDAPRLRALGDRVVVAAGEESGDTLAARGARAVAAALGAETVDLPSHHSGFVDQPGSPGDPDAFAVRFREVLA